MFQSLVARLGKCILQASTSQKVGVQTACRALGLSTRALIITRNFCLIRLNSSVVEILRTTAEAHQCRNRGRPSRLHILVGAWKQSVNSRKAHFSSCQYWPWLMRRTEDYLI